jgi:hypothetical protein
MGRTTGNRATSLKQLNNSTLVPEKRVCFDIKKTGVVGRKRRNLSMCHITDVTLEGIPGTIDDVVYKAGISSTIDNVKTNSNHGSNNSKPGMIMKPTSRLGQVTNTVVIANRIKRKELGRGANKSMIDNREIIKEVLDPERKPKQVGNVGIKVTYRRKDSNVESNSSNTANTVNMINKANTGKTSKIEKVITKQPVKENKGVEFNKKESVSNKISNAKDILLKEALNKVIKTGKDTVINKAKTIPAVADGKVNIEPPVKTRMGHTRTKSAIIETKVETARKSDPTDMFRKPEKKTFEVSKKLETARTMIKPSLKEQILVKPGSNGTKHNTKAVEFVKTKEVEHKHGDSMKLKEDLKTSSSNKIDISKDKLKELNSYKNSKENLQMNNTSFGKDIVIASAGGHEFSFQPKKDNFIVTEIPVSNPSEKLVSISPKEEIRENKTLEDVLTEKTNKQSVASIKDQVAIPEVLEVVESVADNNRDEPLPVENHNISRQVENNSPQISDNNMSETVTKIHHSGGLEAKLSGEIGGEFDQDGNQVYKFNSKIFRTSERNSKSEIDIIIKPEEPETAIKSRDETELDGQERVEYFESDEEESKNTINHRRKEFPNVR